MNDAADVDSDLVSIDFLDNIFWQNGFCFIVNKTPKVNLQKNVNQLSSNFTS